MFIPPESTTHGRWVRRPRFWTENTKKNWPGWSAYIAFPLMKGPSLEKTSPYKNIYTRNIRLIVGLCTHPNPRALEVHPTYLSRCEHSSMSGKRWIMVAMYVSSPFARRSTTSGAILKNSCRLSIPLCGNQHVKQVLPVSPGVKKERKSANLATSKLPKIIDYRKK